MSVYPTSNVSTILPPIPASIYQPPFIPYPFEYGAMLIVTFSALVELNICSSAIALITFIESIFNGISGSCIPALCSIVIVLNVELLKRLDIIINSLLISILKS